jgi:hypothetical protein
MPLEPGNETAGEGMSKAIYDEIVSQLSGSLNDLEPEAQNAVTQQWQRLAFAIATGVISHLKSNMEIFGIRASGPVTTDVTVTIGGAEVTGVGTGNVITNQSGATTGHVR